ncbi:hypothetical protein LARV_03913 [Longilinea arvoryzae]|uniref:4-amino-4-deoxy-L-arabinose transferase n=1 Tax=Longilinea arvoryzae TaxID=360412 RepID=A0A0K8MZP1_9CHLR|nr:hypothetical protein [Longilinea arvoryzae]GAP16117.1 hypothetical protein LARV_03913 [Longilinea arvoryzae]
MRKPQLTTILSISILLIALAARLIPGPRTIDDSYITFRYARNLLAGEGFVYNPGQPIQGTTTPLYTFIMAGLGLLTGGVNADFPVNAWLFNALADALTCYLLIRLGKFIAEPVAGRRRGPGWAGYAVALVWSIAPYSVTFSIGGLETSLYVLLLTGLALAYAKRRRALTGLLGALAILTRPDAVLLVGVLILDRLVRAVRKTDEPLSARELGAFLIPTLGWVLFATLTFGSPVPHSVQAKLGAYRLDDYAALIRLIQHYATPFMEQNLIGSALAVGLGLVLYPFLYVIGARRIYKSEPRLLGWLVYPGLYFLAFALPNPLIFRWYLTPPLPVYMLGILTGVETLVMGRRYAVSGTRYPVSESPNTESTNIESTNTAELSSSSFSIQHSSFSIPSPLLRIVLLLALLLLPTLLSLSEWRLHPDHGADRPAPEMAWYKLELLYRQAADFAAPQMSSNTVLAAGDVGVLGYYTPARILDTVGLNSPEALDYYPLDKSYYVINYAIAPGLILDQQPDWIVLLEVYGRNGLLPNPQFQAQYELIKKIPTDIYGSDGMLIFRRR